MSEAPSPSVVCITGAHRSGTSMLAQLLHACGVYLGPASELMEPSPDNPEGFWEHLGFVALNDEILRHFGGSWDLPPQITEAQAADGPFEIFKEKARQLCDGMAEAEHWGWKDPRNCLTLPFWRQMIPDLRVVVIVRHPLEVAASLHARNGFSRTLGFHLWRIYNDWIVTSEADEAILVTHYDSFFRDAAAEVARILRHLRIPAPMSGVDLSALVSTVHRNNYATRQEVAQANIPEAVSDLYDKLVARSGELHAGEFRIKSSSVSDKPQLPTAASSRTDEVVTNLTLEVLKRTAWAEQLDTELTRAARVVTELQAEIAERTSWAGNLESDLAAARAVVADLQARVAERTAWAQNANRDKADAVAAFAKLQQEFEERTAWALTLDDECKRARALNVQLQAELQARSTPAT